MACDAAQRADLPGLPGRGPGWRRVDRRAGVRRAVPGARRRASDLRAGRAALVPGDRPAAGDLRAEAPTVHPLG